MAELEYLLMVVFGHVQQGHQGHGRDDLPFDLVNLLREKSSFGSQVFLR